MKKLCSAEEPLLEDQYLHGSTVSSDLFLCLAGIPESPVWPRESVLVPYCELCVTLAGIVDNPVGGIERSVSQDSVSRDPPVITLLNGITRPQADELAVLVTVVPTALQPVVVE